jgi:hypothetical protein
MQGRRQNEYLAALHETTLGIVRHLDLEALLETLIERAVGLVSGHSAFIYLPQPGADVIEREYSTAKFEPSSSSGLRRGEGLAGKIWQTAEPMMVEDYQSWNGRSESFQADPLALPGELAGLLHQHGQEEPLGSTRLGPQLPGHEDERC